MKRYKPFKEVYVSTTTDNLIYLIKIDSASDENLKKYLKELAQVKKDIDERIKEIKNEISVRKNEKI